MSKNIYFDNFIVTSELTAASAVADSRWVWLVCYLYFIHVMFSIAGGVKWQQNEMQILQIVLYVFALTVTTSYLLRFVSCRVHFWNGLFLSPMNGHTSGYYMSLY